MSSAWDALGAWVTMERTLGCLLGEPAAGAARAWPAGIHTLQVCKCVPLEGGGAVLGVWSRDLSLDPSPAQQSCEQRAWDQGCPAPCSLQDQGSVQTCRPEGPRGIRDVPGDRGQMLPSRSPLQVPGSLLAPLQPPPSPGTVSPLPHLFPHIRTETELTYTVLLGRNPQAAEIHLSHYPQKGAIFDAVFRWGMSRCRAVKESSL